MKKTKRIYIIIMLFIITSFVMVESLVIVEGNKIHKEESEYLFILGAKLYGDRPSPVLLERLKIGSEYLNLYENTKVVVTGGQGSDELISEAKAMKNYLLENGIEGSRIILEDESVNTFENIKFGLKKIREFDDRDNIEIVIATSRFHVFRSKLIAKRLGLKPYGLPAKVPPTTIFTAYIREYFALIKTFLLDR